VWDGKFIPSEAKNWQERGKAAFRLTTLSVAKIVYRRRWINEIRAWSIVGMAQTEGQQKYLERNFFKCHFFHHKTKTYWPGIVEPGPLQWRAGHQLHEQWRDQNWYLFYIRIINNNTADQNSNLHRRTLLILDSCPV